MSALDIHRVMDSMSESRPIFHSEADFQHALAWAIRETVPNIQVRLEFNPFPDEDRRSHLDIWLPDRGIALELKYPTRAIDRAFNGERFVLRNHNAQDLARYDFLKDVQRLERVARERPAKAGYAVMLTNDRTFWRNKLDGKNDMDAAFLIHEGRRVSGELKWAKRSGQKKTKERESPIRLSGDYALRWRDYSTVSGARHGDFRYLAVSVSHEASGRGQAG